MKACWLLLALAACDGLGEPVVGRLGRFDDSPQPMCMGPEIDCDRPIAAATGAARLAPVLPAAHCPDGISPAACSDTQASGCTRALQLVAGRPLEAPAQACVTLELDLAQGSDHGELGKLSLRASRLVVRATQPSAFVLSDVDLRAVAIELDGPITLRLSGALDEVSVVGDQALAVTLSESTVSKLSVALAGALRVERSTLEDSQLAADTLTLETVQLRALSADAARLIGIELRGERLRIDVADLSLSGLDVGGLVLARCERALLMNARLDAPQLGACTERLRAHDSSFIEARAWGTIESVHTGWHHAHFGAAGGASTLELWGGALANSVLCTGLTRLTRTEDVIALCNDCTELPAPGSLLCAVDAPAQALTSEQDGGVSASGNEACPQLDQPLPLCTPAPKLEPPY